MKSYFRALFSVIAVLALFIALAGCATNPGTQPVTPAQMAALEVSTTTAIRLANDCLTSRVGPCADPATRAAVIADVHKAHDAFKGLQAASTAGQPAALAAMNTALTVLIDLTPKQ